ncbi:MAG: YbhB/YbcL family Raf kinase inhibitor-like protein [Elusimicrobia bacterium]|nr:YbhB/YbcL family Raf kinase inhibitor-like protein [Elusimicrobiota bacterium]
MRLSCPEIVPGAPIPRRFAAEGEDLSPPLFFSEVPETAAELALTCLDPDAPGAAGAGWTHWLIYGLAPKTPGLPEGLARRQIVGGGTQGLNGWGALGWGGPLPPPGPAHRYIFTLYALGARLTLGPGSTLEALKKAMSGRVLAQAELIGLYRRD